MALMSTPLSVVRSILFDMDGVLWHGDTPLADLSAVFRILTQLQITWRFVTNNARKTPQQYVEKLARFGVMASEKEIVTSATATSQWLGQTLPRGAAIYAIGEDGLLSSLREKGFDLLISTQLPTQQADLPPCSAVVIGLHQQVTYSQLALASLHVQRGALFVGCNPDLSLPHELGLLPGAGSLLAFVQAASGVAPIIVGKPQPLMFQLALQEIGGSSADTLFVGDRLETDIAGANGVGLPSVLLLSGVSQSADLAHTPHRPTYVYPDLTTLVAEIERAQTGRSG